MRFVLACLAVMGVALWTEATAAGEADPLKPYQWHRRLLVVFAPSETEPRLVGQRDDMRRHAAGYLDRDLTVFFVVGEGPVQAFPVQPVDFDERALRARFDVAPEAFRIFLLGKDGGVKVSSGEVVGACRLFGIIDGMPMRRDEMKTRGGAVQC